MIHDGQPDGRIRRNIHSHAWIAGAAGLTAGLILMIYVPSLEAVSRSILLFAGFHIVGALVLLASAYSLVPRQIVRRWTGRAKSRAKADAYDFGWGPEWMNGLAVAAMAAWAVAVAIQVALPAYWPLAYIVLLLGAAAFVGNQIMRSFRSQDHAVLPMVRLLHGDNDLVLDAGCGAGRTTIALGRIPGHARVVAVDRFDADYIEDGGRALLDRNLALASLTDRVKIEAADLTALPFAGNTFDAAVSTNVIDYLGRGKERGLREIFRVLKPGGRFLMAVWVPGWTMFAVANVLSFLLTSKRGWRAMAQRTGFAIADEGVFNFAWFIVLEKPAGNAEGSSRGTQLAS